MQIFKQKQEEKDYSQILANGFVRAELEDTDKSKDYKQGYIKGVRTALYDLGFTAEEVAAVRKRLEKYLKE